MKNGTTQSYRCVNGGVIKPPSYVDSYYYCGTNYSNKDDDNRHGVRPSSSSSTSLLLSSRDLHDDDDDDDDANDYNDNSDHFSVPQSQASFITATIMDRCVRAFLVLILTTTGAVGIQNTLLPAMAATPTLVLPAAPAPTTITTQARTEALTALALIDNGTIRRSVSSSSFSVAAAESISLAGVAGTTASSSADAARLLLDTPAKQRTIPTKVRNQILKQIQQQDTRLAECEGSEDDTWEQCFYYGKKGGSASTKDTNNDAPFLTPLPPDMLTPDMVGSRIPTW